MIFSKGLLVSLPASELRSASLPACLFDRRDLTGQPISGTLRAALRLLAEACETTAQRCVLIARPEIFIYGEARAWLASKLGGIEDHLNVSDGSTLQLVPGLKNHLLFYNPSLARNNKALQRYIGRAPEIALQISNQINTAFTFRIGRTHHTPLPFLMQTRTSLFFGEAEFRKFYMNANSVSDSIARLDAAPAVSINDLSNFEDVVYVPCTDSAAAELPFCRLLAAQILSALQQPARLLIIGAPLAQEAEDSFSRMISLLLLGLGRCGVVLPRAVIPNVVIVSTFMEDAYFAAPGRRSGLILHETFEYWRLPVTYYERFHTISFAQATRQQNETPALLRLLQEACGRMPDIVPMAANPQASVGITVPDE